MSKAGHASGLPFCFACTFFPNTAYTFYVHAIILAKEVYIMKHMKMISLTLAVMLIFSACTSGEVTENPNQKENYDIINPLTGQALDKDISGRRPFVFVLNNLRAALPQCAVSDADIIYEAPVEGGITRMLAVYQDITGIGNVGAIRSATHISL